MRPLPAFALHLAFEKDVPRHQLRIGDRPRFGKSLLIFEGVDRERLDPLGEVRAPGLADLFLAKMGAPQ